MPETLETLGGAHGTAIGSFAYLVLQHQTDAEQILASTLATALRRRDWPEGDEAVRRWLLGLASREILRGSSQTGEVAPLLPDPRGRSDRLPMLAALAELDPPARMAVVLYYFCDLPSDVVAAVLDDDPVALRSDLNDARNRLQSRVDEADAVDG